jgi:hypothetical protein
MSVHEAWRSKSTSLRMGGQNSAVVLASPGVRAA